MQSFFRSIAADLYYGLRLLRVGPVLPALAIATLALGLGATTAVVAILDAVFVHPVRYRSPAELVQVAWTDNARPGTLTSGLAITTDFARRWQEESAVFEAIGLSGSLEARFLTVLDEPGERFSRPRYQAISPGFLDVFQTAPVLGRNFGQHEIAGESPTVALVGEAFWRRRFGGSPAAIGSPITFTTGVATVIGVLPGDFFPATDIWLPLRTGGLGTVHGRLRRGASGEAILAELQRRAAELGRPSEAGYASRSLRPIYLSADALNRINRSGLAILTVAVVLTMALAVINIGGLLLIRGLGRRRELAIRASCGAGPARLRRQLITESLLIATVSGVIGMVCAPACLKLFLTVMPRLIPPHSDPSISVATLFVGVVITIVSGTLMGLLPAFRLSRIASLRPDQAAASTTPGGLPSRVTGTLICLQTALSVAILGLVSLLVLDLSRTIFRDPGVRLQNLVRLSAEPTEWSPAAWSRYYPALLAAIRQMPEVDAAGAVSSFPEISVAPRVRVELATREELSITSRSVLPGYLDALGVKVLAGNLPTDADRGGPPGVVLNETAARRFSQAGVSVAEPFLIRRVPHRVLAVVQDTRIEAPLGDDEPAMYQVAGHRIELPMSVLVRLKGPSPGLSARLQDAARSSGQPALVGEVMSGPSFIWQESRVRTQLEFLRLLSVWSILGTCLVASGIAGLTAYAVAARSRELAIRVALGAPPLKVLWAAIGGSFVPTLLGLVFGLVGAAVSSTALAGFLINVSRRDPTGYFGAAIALLAVAVASAWLSARRVTRLDSTDGLRQPA